MKRFVPTGLILTGAVLLATVILPSSATAQVRASAACEYDDTKPFVEDYQSLLTFSDPFLGASNAPVVVIEFFDPNCSACRRLHPTMKRLVESHGELARVYPVPFMLWPERSMLPILALHVAAQDGKFHEMMDAQFDGTSGRGDFTVPELMQMAVDIGLDEDTFRTRMQRGLYRKTVWDRREQVAGLGFRGTPTVLINGRVVKTLTHTCLAQLVEEAAATG